MSRFALTLASLALVPWSFVWAAEPGAGQTAAPAAAEAVAAEEVRSLLLRQAEAWNRGDLEAFTAFYADDAVFLSTSGVTRGRDEVLARYRRRYPDRAAMGRLSFEVLDLRLAEGRKAATVAARWHLAYPEETREDASGLTLLVLLPREKGGWMIVQDASM